MTQTADATISHAVKRSDAPVIQLRDQRRLLALPGIITILGALVSAAISFVILIGLAGIDPTQSVTLAVIGVNTFFILALIALIARETHRIISARRVGKAASRLHVRIVAMFAIVAAVPAILIAIIASITLEIGLDRWFEIRTKTIINSSLSIAEAYVQENARNLQGTTLSMANDLDSNRTIYNLDPGGFQRLLQDQARGRALAHAALVRADGSVVMQVTTARDVELPNPPQDAIQVAADGLPALIEPRIRNIVGAIVKLRQIPDLYLYTLRLVDPEVIRARQLVRTNSEDYRTLEGNRTITQIAFALSYLGLALVIIIAAIWTGIAVADRLVRPIRQLIGAADVVSTGNLDIQVPVRRSDGDVASFAETFNTMIRELKSQRNEVVAARDMMDERRRFSEAVLAGVTAGVIGVGQEGDITVVNRSAETMLDIDGLAAVGKTIMSTLPQVGRVFEIARDSRRAAYREQVTFFTGGAERTFNVQVTIEQSERRDEPRAYVVTVDDITDVVQAQRSTAWADVARRIAHEIKNPLTPIQLSAERIRRRFGKVIVEDREIFDQCTDTIIRQVGDIGRMVDEFSSFARMPKPAMQKMDLREALREASFLVEVSKSDIKFERRFDEGPLLGTFDSRMIGQAIGNVIKNAAEAIEGANFEDGQGGEILVRAAKSNGFIVVDVIDNGRGLPRENRQRLLEPYMTTREKGTGLGLAIVKKIVEEHGGRLELHDAPADFHGGRGAMIRIILPELSDAEGAAKPRQQEQEKAQNGV